MFMQSPLNFERLIRRPEKDHARQQNSGRLFVVAKLSVARLLSHRGQLHAPTSCVFTYRNHGVPQAAEEVCVGTVWHLAARWV